MERDLERQAAFGLLRWSLLGLPVIWVLGLSFIYYHLLAFSLLFLLLLLASRKAVALSVPKSLILFLLYGSFYFLSLVLSVNDSDNSRLISGFYNLSYWFMAAIIIFSVVNLLNYEAVLKIYRSLYIPLCLLGLGAMASLYAWMTGSQELIFKSVIGGFLGNTNIAMLDDSLMLEVLRKDWLFGRAWPRTSVFAPYPNALAASCVLMVGAYVSTIKHWNLRTLLPVMLAAFAFLMTWSRSSILLILFLLVMLLTLSRGLLVTFLMFFLVSLVVAVNAFDVSLYDINNAREGSSGNRIAMYFYGLENLEGLEWLWGEGVKEKVYLFKFPVGSHSTFIGALIKTGILGLGLLLALMCYLCAKSILKALERRFHCKETNTYMVLMLFMFGWMIVEDIDSPQLVMFLFALVIAGDFIRRRDLNHDTVDTRVEVASLSEGGPPVTLLPFEQQDQNSDIELSVLDDFLASENDASLKSFQAESEVKSLDLIDFELPEPVGHEVQDSSDPPVFDWAEDTSKIL